MSGKTIKFNIVESLEGLGKTRFKRFVKNLVDRRQDPRVKLGEVEDRDAMDIAEVLVSKFTEPGALDVAIEVMQLIDCHEEAQELEVLRSGLKKAEAAPCAAAAVVGAQAVAAGPCVASGANKYMVGEKHFVDFHRKELIRRVRTLDPLLDELVDQNAISDEAYSDVRTERKSQEKMRVLYDQVFTTARVKDMFYDILEINEPFLMTELKGK